MFKHILIPIDGSRLALKGAKAGIKLARALRARVTAVYVVPPYVQPAYGDGAFYVPGLSVREYQQGGARSARAALQAVAAEARKAGARCAAQTIFNRPAWDGILRAARAAKCDAIVIASHGRGALGGLLLGSQTQRVLAHSKIPVIVIR